MPTCGADARLTAAQAELIREQTEALRRPRQAAAAAAAQSPQALQEQYNTCAYLLGAGNCTDLKQKLDAAAPAQVPQTHEQVESRGPATPTDKLKADAATFEAIMRSAPPDSKAFQDAAKSLQATNEELAKRGVLK